MRDLRIPKYVSGKQPPSHTQPPPFFFIIFFFRARLEDKWCRARAPRTKVGPTFGEEHRGRYNPRNTEKVHIIYTTPSMNNARTAPRTKWLNARIIEPSFASTDDIKKEEKQKERNSSTRATAGSGRSGSMGWRMPFRQVAGHLGHLGNFSKKSDQQKLQCIILCSCSPILFLFLFSHFCPPMDFGCPMATSDKRRGLLNMTE